MFFCPIRSPQLPRHEMHCQQGYKHTQGWSNANRLLGVHQEQSITLQYSPVPTDSGTCAKCSHSPNTYENGDGQTTKTFGTQTPLCVSSIPARI